MKKQFKFSIIMSVYNVEPYIDEAVESVLKQTIGFENNVQIVFVNDGSKDNSGKICQKYQTLYPDNIIYIEQENKGQSAARNVGLEVVTGEYINFFDPDDVLSDNALEEVDRFFLSRKAEIDFVSIPLVYFEGQKGLHGKYKMMGKKNRLIDLLAEPDCFVLSSAGSFYKTDVFRGRRFDESLSIGEDAEFNFRLYDENPRFGYVCEKGVVYHYRRRLAGGSNVDALRVSKNEKPFLDNVKTVKGVLVRNGSLREYEKEFAAYQLRSVLRDALKESFGVDYSYDTFLADCSEIVRHLDLDFILRRSSFIDTDERRQLFLRLFGSSFSDALKEGLIDASSFDIKLKDAAVRGGKLIVDLVFNNYDCPLDIVVIDDNNNQFKPSQRVDTSSSFDAVYGEFLLDKTHYRQLILPYEIADYRFCFQNTETGRMNSCKMLRATGKPPLMSLGSDMGVVRKGKKFFLKESCLKVVDEPKSAFFAGIDTFKDIKQHSNKLAWLRPLSARTKKYVLIMDRPNKAGDNAQALYEHIMKHGSRQLRRRTFFVLDKHSEGYASLCNKSHVVQPRSLRHKLLFLNARMIYSSHNARQFYIPFAHNGKYYADEFDYTFVWLQHGITKDDISKQANRLHTEDDFIVTASRREQEEFLREAYFYTRDQVILTGFSRYDKLRSNSKRVITVAPTWRSHLSGPIERSGYHAPVPGFECSEYYQRFSALLTDSRFLSLLHSFGYTCQFVCHPGFACYEPFFKKFESDCVTLLPQNRVDYSTIFAESAIFVTDFSSTAFDFAYLRKPVIYYQFDKAEQYSPGYFCYERDGFGPVLKTLDELIVYISKLLAQNSRVDDLYMDRIENFFAFNDTNNCQRILRATLPDDLL